MGKDTKNKDISVAFLRLALAVTIINIVLLLVLLNPADAAFNEIIAGARPQGMGGAFTGLADDANTLYWNPAGMMNIQRYEATAMHARKFSLDVGPSLDLDYGAFTTGRRSWGAFGVSWSREGDKTILSEEILAVSYADRLYKGLSMGMTMSPNANGVTAQPGVYDPALVEQDTMGYDLGFLYEVNKYFSLGVVGRNMGAETGQVIKTELEPGLRVGVAYKPNSKFKIAADVTRRENIKNRQGESDMVAGGVEYLMSRFLAIRAGINDDTVTLGLGFIKSDWQMDYAFWNSEIGDTHRISATMRFGNAMLNKAPEAKIDSEPLLETMPGDKIQKPEKPKAPEKEKIRVKGQEKDAPQVLSKTHRDALKLFDRLKSSIKVEPQKPQKPVIQEKPAEHEKHVKPEKKAEPPKLQKTVIKAKPAITEKKAEPPKLQKPVIKENTAEPVEPFKPEKKLEQDTLDKPENNAPSALEKIRQRLKKYKDKTGEKGFSPEEKDRILKKYRKKFYDTPGTDTLDTPDTFETGNPAAEMESPGKTFKALESVISSNEPEQQIEQQIEQLIENQIEQQIEQELGLLISDFKNNSTGPDQKEENLNKAVKIDKLLTEAVSDNRLSQIVEKEINQAFAAYDKKNFSNKTELKESSELKLEKEIARDLSEISVSETDGTKE
jgi:hypothetical protein